MALKASIPKAVSNTTPDGTCAVEMGEVVDLVVPVHRLNELPVISSQKIERFKSSDHTG